jgi:uncharacterized protein YggE
LDNKKITVLLCVIITLAAVTLGYVFISDNTKAISTLGTATPSPATATTAPETSTAESEDFITVYGQGIVYIEPDIAYITLGYDNLDPDPKKAQDANTTAMDKIITAVKAAGIEDADIQTAQYSVLQEYNYTNDKKETRGYRVTNTVKVKVKDVTKAGDIIKAAYDAGSNLFNGITFDIIKRQDSYLEALDIAMSRAEEKAQKLAQDSGRSVTGVINIVESSPTYSPLYPSTSNYAYSQAAPLADYNGDAISSGQLEISAMVSVTYRLN